MSQRLNIPTVVALDDHIRQMRGLGVNCVPSPPIEEYDAVKAKL